MNEGNLSELNGQFPSNWFRYTITMRVIIDIKCDLLVFTLYWWVLSIIDIKCDLLVFTLYWWVLSRITPQSIEPAIPLSTITSPILLLLTYGMNVGVFYAISTLLNTTVVQHFHYEVGFDPIVQRELQYIVELKVNNDYV